MPTAKTTTPTKARSDASDPRGAPEVAVDFVFDHGLLHVAIENLGDAAAHRVRVAFDKPFRGLGGTCAISELRLFQHLEYLPPRKRIETFVDTTSAYFARREPLRLNAELSFRDARGRAYTRRIAHDLSIYKDIVYLVKPAGASASPAPTAAPAPTSRTGDDSDGHAARPTLRKLQLPR
jgi:hypothetical protein